MTPHQAYRRTNHSGWTRIEMLLAVYDATLLALDNGIDALNQNRLESFPALQLRATQMCLLVISGIDTKGSETSTVLYDLCLFCMDQIRNPDVTAWKNARDLLNTVREGFEGIREEGIRLEQDGQISPLPQDAAHVSLQI